MTHRAGRVMASVVCRTIGVGTLGMTSLAVTFALHDGYAIAWGRVAVTACVGVVAAILSERYDPLFPDPEAVADDD